MRTLSTSLGVFMNLAIRVILIAPSARGIVYPKQNSAVAVTSHGQVSDANGSPLEEPEALVVVQAAGKMAPRRGLDGAATLVPGFSRGAEQETPDAQEAPDRTPGQVNGILSLLFFVMGLSWCAYFGVSWKAGAEMKLMRLVLICWSLGFCSWAMSVANKSLVTALQSPALICTVQLFITSFIVAIVGHRRFTGSPMQILRWCSVAVVFFIQILTSLYTMQYLSLSMLNVIRNLGPLITLPLELMIMPEGLRPIMSLSSVLALLLLVASTFAYFGGIHVMKIGIVYAALNMCLAVGSLVLRRRLLTTECSSLSTETCMLVNNAVGFVPCLMLSAFAGELTRPPSIHYVFTDDVCILVLLSGIIGTGISYFGLALQREITATSFMVLENVVRMAEIYAGVALFGDPITWPWQSIGLIASFVGAVWYGRTQSDVECGPSLSEAKAAPTKLSLQAASTAEHI